MTLQQILEEVKNGQLSVEHAEGLLKKEGYEEMDYAKLDTTRKARTGFAEVVYCARKADEHLLNIYQKLYEEDGEVFGTRASEYQYELVKKVLPNVVYDPISGILKIEKEKEHIGKVAVCTAGTADISVAEEAAQTAEYFGTHVERIYDVGVSGMHRLFSRLDTIQEANCVVAVAGMEGALASVMGGLVKRPVIAVPTSVGYGASFHGLSALLTMINSCANGIAVVNIDNGFGAGYLATQINRLAGGKKMRNKLYLECTSGISGDMTVAALLDLGADQKKLVRTLKSLPVKGFDIKISRVMKSGIDACDFDVLLDHDHENHDHDMKYLHGDEGDFHGHDHEKHHHDHGGSRHGHHHHEHRGLNEIMEIIDHSDMTDRAKSYGKRTFKILAEAEAKAHNVPVNQVHFHEVGAVDSIVDILSVAICMDDLDVEEVIVPRLCEGSGTIRCQHGILPVPVPAVSNIVSAHQLKLHITSVQGELITPTGAAIVAAFLTSEKLPEDFTVRKIGIGAGKRQYECPGILRAMLIRGSGEEASGNDACTETDTIIKLESNIDDCTGETLGYVMELLYEAGAREANYMPVFMKKNRPAWLLTVLCKEEQVSVMEQIIFRETTTIGIRRQEMGRTILKREKRAVTTPLGEVEVKVCTFDGQEYFYPEYESVKKLCEKTGISYKEAYHMAVRG